MAIPLRTTLRVNLGSHSTPHHYLSHWNNFNGQLIWKGQSLALMVSRYFDRGLIEMIGPLGLQRLFHFLTFNVELLASGFLPHYALLLLSFGLLLISATALTTSLPILASPPGRRPTLAYG